jgi:hypothetical protein
MDGRPTLRAWIVDIELVVGCACLVAGPLALVAMPRYMGLFARGPDPLLVGAGGILGMVLGVAGMIRLSRPDPEAGRPPWRYRDH